MMTLFDSGMKSEKVATIALVIIIVGVLSVFLTATYGQDILENFFGETEEEKVETGIIIGDCADVNYIGRFQVNDTVFDTSREGIAKEWGIYDENQTYEP